MKSSACHHSTPDDVRHMTNALKLAWSVKGKTFPNPAVGTVVVANGARVASGATTPAGGPHAEREAIRKAGDRARGATLYVTLEPCCHFGRTPPCTDAIIAAGIKKVVVAVPDPNPLVNGKGIKALRAAGIRVETGLLQDEARQVNEDFFWAITRRRAWITLKLASTLDGRIADSQGESQWITGEQARFFAHELRRRHAAIAIGRSTLEHDDPRLTVRHRKGYSPARCVFTYGIKVARNSYFYKHAGEARSIVVVSGGRRRRNVDDPASGMQFWYTGEKEPGASLKVFTEMAYENDLTSVLVEGGQKLASGFLESGLVNRVYLFYGNKIFGRGREALLFSRGLPVHDSISLSKTAVLPLGDTLVVTGVPVMPG